MERRTNWGAALFLVLFPAAVGCVLGGLVLDPDSAAGRFPVAYLSVALVVALLGAAAPVLRIKKPSRSYRMLAGVGRSPLSRQAALVAVFLVLLLVAWALALAGVHSLALGVVTVVVGAAAVLAAALVYVLGSQPAWRHWSTPASLFGGLLALGLSLSATIALAWSDQGLLDGSAGVVLRVLILVGVVLVGAALWAWRRNVRTGGMRTAGSAPYLKGTGRGLYAAALLAVLVVGVAAAVSFASAWLLIVSFACSLIGLLLVRQLFFLAAAPLTWRSEVKWSRPPIAAGKEA